MRTPLPARHRRRPTHQVLVSMTTLATGTKTLLRDRMPIFRLWCRKTVSNILLRLIVVISHHQDECPGFSWHPKSLFRNLRSLVMEWSRFSYFTSLYFLFQTISVAVLRFCLKSRSQSKKYVLRHNLGWTSADL